ncbi:MAG: helix-turn-helix domain-containing protein [Bulleidia sp.]
MKPDIQKRSITASISIKAEEDCYKLIIFRHGEADVETEKKTFTCNTEELVLLKPGRKTKITGREKRTEISLVSIPIQMLEALSNDNLNLSEGFSYAQYDVNIIFAGSNGVMTLRNLLNKAENIEKEEMQYGLVYYQDVLISAFLVTLLRICIDSDIKYISRRRKTLMIDDVFVYIRQNLANDLSLAKLESVFFVSKEHLCRRFHQETGVSIHQYILDARLSKSQSLIRKGLSVSEIYKQCGFKSYNHFFKAFKKVYGCTPSQFRKISDE